MRLTTIIDVVVPKGDMFDLGVSVGVVYLRDKKEGHRTLDPNGRNREGKEDRSFVLPLSQKPTLLPELLFYFYCLLSH